MKEIKKAVLVMDIMKKTVTCDINDSLEYASQLMVTNQINHIPIISKNKLLGIVTSWDIAKSLATELHELKKSLDRGKDVSERLEKLGKLEPQFLVFKKGYEEQVLQQITRWNEKITGKKLFEK